jgi:hypothetical protein
VGGISPPHLSLGGGGGNNNILEPPPGGGSGEAPPKRNFWENCLVKYCNFIVNLNHSSLGCRYDGRSYVRVFFP